ncbi:MAG: hypothetical protein OEX12_09670 [Gammaproteobacteria bacterium]|nr:hypothetical protein [Gammaproteobacteria bacterium]
MNLKLSLNSLLCSGMVLFFFMPWLQMAGGLINYTGYEIPYTGKTLALIFSSETYMGETRWTAYLAYLLYLLPTLAVYNVVRDLQKQKELFVSIILVPAIPILIFTALLIKMGVGAFDHYDIGLYLSVLIGLLIVLNMFGLLGISKRR